jgi:hypothetical protein
MIEQIEVTHYIDVVIDGMEYHLPIKSIQFLDTVTGEKGGCKDKAAVNYCASCSHSVPEVCIYNANPSQGG